MTEVFREVFMKEMTLEFGLKEYKNLESGREMIGKK